MRQDIAASAFHLYFVGRDFVDEIDSMEQNGTSVSIQQLRAAE